VILYFLVTGHLPFTGDNDEQVIQAILKGQVKHSNAPLYQALSANLRDLIEGLLRVSPKQRLSVTDALAHHWLDESNQAALKAADLKNTLSTLKQFVNKGKMQQAMLGFFVQNILTQGEL